MEIVLQPNNARLTSYPSEGKALGAVIICPGGAYSHVAERCGRPVAEAFSRQGYHAFVLDYTVEPAPLGVRPLRDLAEAILHVRCHAEYYGVSPNRIALCGFSAGGHLAASLGVYWNRPDFFGGDQPAEIYRPNAVILSYPVISALEFQHSQSLDNLSGDNADMRQAFGLENQVGAHTPPVFMWHTASDEAVPVQNSMLFASELAAHRVPFEYHVFPFGAHGLSLATPELDQPELNRLADPHVARWFSLCVEWLGIILE